MGLKLRDGVSFCISNDQTVLCDIHNDRFFALPPSWNSAFRAALSNDCHGDIDSALQPFFRSGLLLKTDDDQKPQALLLPTPTSSALDRPYSKVPIKSLISGLFAHWLARHALAHEHLKDTLARLSRRKAANANAQFVSGDLSEILPAFLATRRWMPSQDNCLPLSLALVEFLARRGAFPTLVIGVRMRPYGVHAWVQQGGLILNDRVDTVRRYTPIIAI